MTNYKIIDPNFYSNYNNFIVSNFNPNIFHSLEWAKTLKLAFNYNLNYFIFFDNNIPSAVIPLCEIRSFLTGKRGVSLPYTDYCTILNKYPNILDKYLNLIIDYALANDWDYVEFRTTQILPSVQPYQKYLTHEIDITKPTKALWDSLEDNNKRNIKKAYKNHLLIKIQNDILSLNDFYHLHLLTRRRHNLPPQPYKFFKSIYTNIISKGLGNIVSCYLKNKLLASSIYFSFNKNAIFAFGASDPDYHHLRPNNLVMWESILWLKEQKNYTLNLGRTDFDNKGLLRYKRGWGGTECILSYYLIGIKTNKTYIAKNNYKNFKKNITKYIPRCLINLVTGWFYKHFG